MILPTQSTFEAMPLRAIINDQDIVSTELSDDDWQELRNEIREGRLNIKLPCCGKPGRARTSKLGLRHFYHQRSDDCNYKPESAQHLMIKSDIVRASRVNGWNAISEYACKDWIADVMATNGKRQIIFEVQWSRQSAEEIRLRHERYRTAGMKCCWLMKQVPKELCKLKKVPKPDTNLPIFKIGQGESGDIYVELEQGKMSVYEFVNHLYHGHLKYCDVHSVQRLQTVEILFYEMECWNCKKEQHSYHVTPFLKSNCGMQMYWADEPWSNVVLDRQPAVLQFVREFLRSPRGSHLVIGTVKERWSSTVERSYVSFGCAYCDAIFGDFHRTNDACEGDYQDNAIRVTTEIELTKYEEEYEHWCYSPEKSFC